MKLKHLESALSSVPTPAFTSPKVTLEQYPTSAHLTASVIATALRHEDVGDGLTALDLGCGTGMLGIGCALVGCDHVIMVDCDYEALQIAKTNVDEMELEEQFDFVLAKVEGGSAAAAHSKGNRRRDGRKDRRRGGRGGRPAPPRERNQIREDGLPLREKCVDTVMTNPPFGTKHNEGIDMQFLYTATQLARRSVYSFHKSSTRDFIVRKIRDEWKLDVDVVAQMRFDIQNMYKFHQKKSVDVEVDLIRVYWPGQRRPETVDTQLFRPAVTEDDATSNESNK